MSVKILVLKSGEDVIADVQEMVSSDEKVIGYFLTKPCVVKLINSNPITKEESIPLKVDWVVTMVTPVEKIYDMYTEDVLNDGQTTEKTSDTDK